jgi:hypothetical protein
MQNLGRKRDNETCDLRAEKSQWGKKKSRKGKGLNLSSVAKSWAPRSWHMVSIISCSLTLPMKR